MVHFCMTLNGNHHPKPMMRPPIHFNTVQFTIGIAALILGVLVYVLDRPAGQTYFIPGSLDMSTGLHSAFGTLGNHLPTFFHTLSFCLITAALLNVRTPGALVICTSWLMVDAAFEIGQHADIAPLLAKQVPEWFNHLPVLENTAGYFLHGNFDPLDLLSIFLGALVAFGLILVTQRFTPSGGNRTDGV